MAPALNNSLQTGPWLGVREQEYTQTSAYKVMLWRQKTREKGELGNLGTFGHLTRCSLHSIVHQVYKSHVERASSSTYELTLGISE